MNKMRIFMEQSSSFAIEIKMNLMTLYDFFSPVNP